MSADIHVLQLTELWHRAEARRGRRDDLVYEIESRADVVLDLEEQLALKRAIRIGDDGRTLVESPELEDALCSYARGELSPRLTKWWRTLLSTQQHREAAT